MQGITVDDLEQDAIASLDQRRINLTTCHHLPMQLVIVIESVAEIRLLVVGTKVVFEAVLGSAER